MELPKVAMLWNGLTERKSQLIFEMKNAVFWDIKTQFIPHMKHYFPAYRAKPLNVM
jgi:hypothetical protein